MIPQSKSKCNAEIISCFAFTRKTNVLLTA